MKSANQFIILTLVIFSSTLFADEKRFEKKEGKYYIKDFLIVESMFLANAWLMARYPKRMSGPFILLGIPLAYDPSFKSPVINIVSFQSIAIYNWNINTNKIPKKKIFENNLILWHAYALVNYWAGNFDQNIQVTPTDEMDGLKISLVYNF